MIINSRISETLIHDNYRYLDKFLVKRSLKRLSTGTNGVANPNIFSKPNHHTLFLEQLGTHAFNLGDHMGTGSINMLEPLVNFDKTFR